MAGFGGSIKLTGENEYKNALRSINQSLREVSSSMQLTKAQFDASDKSTSSLAKAQSQLSEAYNKQKKEVENLRTAYNSFSEKVQTQVQAHQKLEEEYKDEMAVLKSIKRHLGENSEAYQTQKTKVDELSQKLATSEKNTRENEQALSKMATALNKAETELVKTSKEMDELGKETKETEQDVKGAGEGFTVFKGIVADLGARAISSAINGLKQLGSAMINVGKQAISSYADYEQLVGGVKTLFKESAGTVENYANQAYKTAGMSANEYMETITSFSASLIQGLGGDTKKASEIGNMAIVDMSDNANKMGTSIEMIQNAYQGFAKDNFTMLDNLKLGYGGTAGEMARLINETGVMGKSFKATAKNVKDVPFDKMVEAIHQVQEEMGITGTTSVEASDTISGSVNSMKASWQNLLTGIADGNQEVGPLVDNFVDSVITVAKNLIPRITEVMDGFKEVIKQVWSEVLPQLEEDIPELKPLIDAFQFIIKNGPIIISTLAGIVAGMTAFKVAGMITTLVTGFKTFFTTIKAGQGIMAGLNAIMSANPFGIIALAVVGLVTAFITLWNTSEGFRNFWIGLWETIKTTVISVWETVSNFFTVTIPETFNNVLQAITNFKDNVVNFFTVTIPNAFTNFINGVITFKDNVINFFKELPYKIGFIIGEFIGNVINGIIAIKDFVTVTIPEIINNIVTFFSQLPDKIWTWLVNAYNNVTTWGANMKQKAIEVGTNFINNAINFFKQLPSKIWSFLSDVISKVNSWTSDMTNKARQGAQNTFNAVVNGIKELPSRMLSIGRDIVEGLWNGIKNAGSWIKDKVGDFARGILDGMKSALGIHSPSKLFEDQVGKNIALGIGEGFTNEMGLVSKEMENAIPTNFDTSINGISSANSGLNNYSYNTIVLAFQEALSNMKIELDDEEAGRFVRRTVEQAIYT